jgi:hypothetical protein
MDLTLKGSKMKFRVVFLVTIILPWFVYDSLLAQGESQKKPVYGWKKEVVGVFNLAQASFDNWVSGGENTLAWQFGVNSNFTLDQEKLNWANSGKVSYGESKIGDTEARKSTDEIKLESVLTYKLGVFVDPFASLSALTQFGAGYAYSANDKTEISSFLDPGYFTLSAGVSHSEGDMFKSRLGPALKLTVTSNHSIPYADDPNTSAIEKTKTEVGISSVTDLKLNLEENVLFTSKLDIFSNLKSVNQIVVRWDNLFTAKVSQYVTTSLNIELFYDKSISTQRQLREFLALGLSYSFL